MAAPKLPKRLFKNKDVIHSYQHDRESKAGMKHMARDHLDVLQNIEFSLVRCAREDSSIDDGIIDRALRICMRGTEISDEEDPRVATVCDMLGAIRATREDVPDNIWRAGLRTVNDSVQRHSDLRPGEK